MLLVQSSDHVLGVHSFADGFVPMRAPREHRDDDSVQARCLWLSKHGRPDEADELLENYCSSKR